MEFQISANYSHSASNSPTAAKKFGFQLDPRQWGSEEELCFTEGRSTWYLHKTLPNPAKHRSASVADILDESTIKVKAKRFVAIF